MINLVGTWNMNGNQTNVAHSAWKARLVLNAGGGLVWTETQGANVGATRMGSWKFDGKVFSMEYVAPNSGRVEWKSNTVSPNSMQGVYTTPQADPQPVGWGGVWDATKQ